MENIINTGDLIVVTKPHNILGRLTQFFTRSPYVHAGIALWIDNELYMAELNGGRNHIIPLCQLTDYDVYAHPENLKDIEQAIHLWLKYPINYGMIAFVSIGLLDWFKIKAFVHWRKILVCSGYCVAIYETSGWPEHSRVISPADLAAYLKIKAKVRDSILTPVGGT